MIAGRAVIPRRAATSFARSPRPVAFAGSPEADGVYLQARMEFERQEIDPGDRFQRRMRPSAFW